ncbi:MAG: aminopeptidase P family protein [Thermoanaerobacterales bacterium]|jgi:Xaa-Pro dipeptidase|nr:aminopeptidase P family protein [Thermoanaerobacterales bacterium]
MLKKERVNKLAQSMRESGIDVVIIGPSGDLEYFTEYAPFVDARFKALFVLSDGRCFYICPALYHEDAVLNMGTDIKMYVWNDSAGFLSAVATARDDYKIFNNKIAVNDTIRAVDLLDIEDIVDAEFSKASQMLGTLRLYKDDEELANLKTASKMADEVMKEVIEYIRPGLTEGNIKDKIKELFKLKGADGLSFEPIVACGANTSQPHYGGETGRIKEKDIVILDFGCRYKGYCSDTTRTVFIGDVTDEQKKIYDIVLSANQKAEQAVKAGLTAEQIDKTARAIIEIAGYGEYFVHRTGHGIGLSVHEAPNIMEGNKQILSRGIVFSVEPGIYIPGKFGIRIEDLVHVTEHGAEVLNATTKELIVIK